ncbi:MAG: universal stress protein [Gammaproteobacteria bacterium]|jgi:universal stress protein A|nr:universal stress protein [Gammaproteobacteria bacterium]MDP6537264.1 universal stress protein [Gammaproteobacteria bacterium]MDP6732437.1 universal stress protein [Gammaproteobacteria bacterium]HAJ76174.1 universal stress protein UspA [Gammaproteobacteria bacterium]
MYNKILVAIDLSNDSQKVIDTAVRMAGDASKLHLVHVVEPVAAAYSMDIYAVNISELQQEAINFAEQRLEKIGNDIGVMSGNAHTLLGAPAPEVRNLASEIGADAIVMGSHGHSGWKILLGSTAIKVLHGATCDVLTVHVAQEE